MKHILITITAVLLVGCAMTGPLPPIQDPSASNPESISDSLRNQINKEIDSMVKEWDEAAASVVRAGEVIVLVALSEAKVLHCNTS